MKKNKIIFLIVFFVIIIILGITLFVRKNINNNDNNNIDANQSAIEIDKELEGTYFERDKQTNEIYNNSEKIVENKEFEGISISNVSVQKYEDKYAYSAKIHNNSGKLIENKNVSIFFKDKDGNELGMAILFIRKFEANSDMNVGGETKDNILNAYTYELLTTE